jgi:hypothetical protein
MKIIEILGSIGNTENIELYFILFLSLFTLWFIVNTVKYYKSKRRKLKPWHRFSREDAILSQYELAKRYAKNQEVQKRYQNVTHFAKKTVGFKDRKA